MWSAYLGYTEIGGTRFPIKAILCDSDDGYTTHQTHFVCYRQGTCKKKSVGRVLSPGMKIFIFSRDRDLDVYGK